MNLRSWKTDGPGRGDAVGCIMNHSTDVQCPRKGGKEREDAKMASSPADDR
jgi:hypothetical protein